MLNVINLSCFSFCSGGVLMTFVGKGFSGVSAPVLRLNAAITDSTLANNSTYLYEKVHVSCDACTSYSFELRIFNVYRQS